MKNWEKLEADEKHILNKHYTGGRGGAKINKVVIHHNAGNLSLRGIYNVWQTRRASAHYQVDKQGRVGQYVWDGNTAWHAANSAANRSSIGIEHANGPGTSGPVYEKTREEGAHLTAAVCVKYKLGRPRWGVNVFPHKTYTSTSCPGSLYGQHKDSYIKRAQYWYDQMTGVKPKAAPKTPTKKYYGKGKTYITTASKLNMRSGATTGYPIKGVLPKGTHWYGTGETHNGWVRGQSAWMRKNGAAPRWVSGKYLRELA